MVYIPLIIHLDFTTQLVLIEQ